jgi:hypothetical protein
MRLMDREQRIEEMRNQTEILPTFEDFDFDKTALPMIVVYHNPEDFPGKYVARLVYSPHGPTKYAIVKDTFSEIRESMPSGMRRIPPFKEDDPVIVEVFI